ncbi:hypothetical protein ACFFS0_31085, partial [Streptomyces coeruleoprunus]
MAVRSMLRTSSLVLITGLLLGVVAWPPHAAADGAGAAALTLSVTVNGKPGRGAERRGIRTGHAVVKHYRLTNRSGADLHRVTVTDPAAPGKALRCPGGQGFWMRGLTSVVCTSKVPAAPGRHTTTVRARAEVPSLGMRPAASARAGYVGVTGALALSVAVVEAVAPRAVLHYVIANPGNRPVYGLRLTDPGLPQARFVCGGRPGTPPFLPAGGTVVCVAQLTGLPPGTYRSTPEVQGTDLLTTLGPRCALVPPPPLMARATAPFTLTAPPPPAPPRAVVPGPVVPGAPGAPGAAAGGAAAPGAPGAAGAPGAP